MRECIVYVCVFKPLGSSWMSLEGKFDTVRNLPIFNWRIAKFSYLVSKAFHDLAFLSNDASNLLQDKKGKRKDFNVCKLEVKRADSETHHPANVIESSTTRLSDSKVNKSFSDHQMFGLLHTYMDGQRSSSSSSIGMDLNDLTAARVLL